MKKLLIALLSTLSISSTFAAINPTEPSATASSGSLDVQMRVGRVVQITGVQDWAINPWNGATTTQTQNLCVFSNNINGYKYDISFDSTSGNFRLKSGSESLPYKIKFNNNDIDLGNGVTAPLRDQPGSDSVTCNGSTNATLEIIVPQANNVHAGTFSDTLSLIVSAQS